MESALFSRLARISGQGEDFENLHARKCDLAKTCCAWAEKSVLYNFHGKRTVFRFEENLRAVWRFWELWRWKTRFAQNVLRMSRKDGFVQFSWKAHCFSVLKRIWGQFRDFENFDGEKRDLAKTCSGWPEKSVLYNFLKSALFSLFEEKFRRVWGFWELWRSKLRFGQRRDVENFVGQNCDLAKTCCACPEKSVRYNFDGKRSVFPFWREF